MRVCVCVCGATQCIASQSHTKSQKHFKDSGDFMQLCN